MTQGKGDQSDRGWRFELHSIPESIHEAAEGFSGRPQWSTDLHLIHTIEGQGVLQVGRRQVETHNHTVLAIPIHTHCSWQKPKGARWRMINLHIRLYDEARRAVHELDLLPVSFAPPDLATTHARLEQHLAAWTGNDARQKGMAATGALALAAGYLAAFGKDWSEASLRLEPRVSEMADHLRKVARRPFAASELARIGGLSISQCNRLFREGTGVSPKTYWMRHRLGLAQSMLSETLAPVQQTANALGFTDIYYFSRWFKDKTGLSPTAFRRQHRGF